MVAPDNRDQLAEIIQRQIILGGVGMGHGSRCAVPAGSAVVRFTSSPAIRNLRPAIAMTLGNAPPDR